jgi:hypothetical protein
MRIVGDLVTNEDGELCVKMQISPQNPEIFDVPLKEVMESFINKRVAIEIIQSEPRWKMEDYE